MGNSWKGNNMKRKKTERWKNSPSDFAFKVAKSSLSPGSLEGICQQICVCHVVGDM